MTPIEDNDNVPGASVRIEDRAEGKGDSSIGARSTIAFGGARFSYPNDLAVEVITGRLPAQNSPSTQGASAEGVPQALSFTFITNSDVWDATASAPTLLVQAARDKSGLYYAALPQGKREQFDEVEVRLQSWADGYASRAAGEYARFLVFVNGFGVRSVEDDGKKAVYRYQGMTNDRRFVVELTFPLTKDGSSEQFSPRLAQLDGIVETLFIDSAAEAWNVSTCLDDADFVKHVTIPDGTEIAPGETFVKTWRMQNTGECTWTDRYSWTFKGGNALTVVDSTHFDLVEPGEEIDISVSLVAPTTPGTYAGQWQLTGTDHFEGVGPEVHYLITVPDT